MVMNDDQMLFEGWYFLRVEFENTMDRYVIEISQMHDLYWLMFQEQEEEQ
jgi:hypothetical protein